MGFHGMFLGSGTGYYALASLAALLGLGYKSARLAIWTAVTAVILVGFGTPYWLLALLAIPAAIFNIPQLRVSLVTKYLMKVMAPIMPQISETERTALEAGVVWVEKDLFSGKPDFKKLLQEPYPQLTAEEKAFIDGPVNRLCESVDDWEVWQTRELPALAWEIMRKEKFFGMIIPKEFGGGGFSALANSEVVQKLNSRSIPLAVTVMVPNSLGPAELLSHYGTKAQKDRYLPKLATGEEMPAFALTEPLAGSDAGSISSSGVLFKGDDGKLYLRMNWNKRWITLAHISTVLGLAFKLKDPDNLLGKGVDVGITCALVPSNTKGVVLGKRHDPLHCPFSNCPTQGHDVVVPAEEAIIGGLDGAGKGWKMLMESLGAGRGISLPAQSAGSSKLVTRAASAHATVRKQFGVSIGKFEGIEEPLARIAGLNYVMEASRRFTCGALNRGIKPPVITAIAKYNTTEIQRMQLNDGMDIMGGQGISLGPRNIIGHGYMSAPISITVEGANILTRTLMIFGQGALRAHPYAYKEVKAIEQKDLPGFDQAFWGHIGHIVANACRSIVLSLTRGRIARSPVGGPAARYWQKLAWASASFAIMSNIAMGALGGTLKLREKITGRYADILSWMYLGLATLKRYEAEGSRKEDAPFLQYAMEHAFYRIQNAFNDIFKNIGVAGLGWLFGGILGTWSRLNTIGSGVPDKISHQVADLIQVDGEQRERMTEGIFYPKVATDALARLDRTFKTVCAASSIEAKLRSAVKAKKLPKLKGPKLVEEALKAGVISQNEANTLKQAEEMRNDCVQVDSCTQEDYVARAVTSPSEVFMKAG